MTTGVKRTLSEAEEPLVATVFRGRDTIRPADFEHFAHNDGYSSDGERTELPAAKRPTLFSQSDVTKDVGLHTRKAIWTSVRGDRRQARCFICGFNDVGWEAFAFDLAHVVARACGGNNTASWNRFPTCSTCNQKVARGTNLLDFIADNYPGRLVSVVKNLWQRFRDNEPVLAHRYFSDESVVGKRFLEQFARTMYGTDGVKRGARSFRRLLPDYDDQPQRGRVVNEHVYKLLRYYDDTAASVEALRAESASLDEDVRAAHRNMARLVRARARKGKGASCCGGSGIEAARMNNFVPLSPVA
jgi:hypothetical protein